MNIKSILIILPLILISLVSAQENNSNQGIFKEIIPSEFKVGDTQFAIKVTNNYNYTLSNIVPVINGKGLSIYDLYPIDILKTGEKGYILVVGNFKEEGNITLSIKWGSETINQVVKVVNTEELERIKQAEIDNKIKQEMLSNLSMQLIDLKKYYELLEAMKSDKKDNDFDVSGISLEQARTYLRDAEAYIFANDPENAKVRIRLAIEEMSYQKIRIETAKPIPSINKFKEYAIIFSTIAGALVTFFVLSELLKNKGKDVVKTMYNVGSKFKKK